MHKQPCDGSNEKAHHSREQNLGPVDAAIQEVVPACIARLVLKSDSLLSADLCLAKHITPTARVSNISSIKQEERQRSRSYSMVPPTTVREELTTSVMDRFVYASAYWVPILPRQRRIPPATANPTEAPLSCNSTSSKYQVVRPRSSLQTFSGYAKWTDEGTLGCSPGGVG